MNRAHPEIPVLTSGDGTTLPGSALLYSTTQKAGTLEVHNNLVWVRGRQVITAGGGYELVRPTFLSSAGQFAQYEFGNLVDFLLDQPDSLFFNSSSQTLPKLVTPDVDQSYRDNQFFGFLQDNLKLTGRLGLSLGLRYDSFGTLASTGTPDTVLVEGSGSGIAQKIENATVLSNNQGQNSLYRPARNDWSGRFGFSYDLLGNGSTIFRGGFGIYYDRPYDLLMQSVQFNDVSNNSVTLPPAPMPVDFLQPLPALLNGAAAGGLRFPARRTAFTGSIQTFARLTSRRGSPA